MLIVNVTFITAVRIRARIVCYVILKNVLIFRFIIMKHTICMIIIRYLKKINTSLTVKSGNKFISIYILDVMGPDDWHPNVKNNAFTNVVSSLAIHWARYMSCLCNRNARSEVCRFDCYVSEI